MYTSVIHTTDTNSEGDKYICRYCPRLSFAFNANIHTQVTIEEAIIDSPDHFEVMERLMPL
jgi:hypothetical protein